jgi:hypothetical protein
VAQDYKTLCAKSFKKYKTAFTGIQALQSLILHKSVRIVSESRCLPQKFSWNTSAGQSDGPSDAGNTSLMPGE